MEVSVKLFDFDRTEIERRRQLVRDLWAGLPVDHIPIHLVVTDPEPLYTIREQFQDGDKQLAAALRVAGLSWQCVSGGDYIPAMRPDLGCSVLATAFGSELYWGDDPNQTCGVKQALIEDVARIADLPAPSPFAGQLAEGAERVRRFAEAGDGLVSVSLLDMAGGLNVASDLLGAERLYVAMREHPGLLECLLGKIQQLFLAAIAAQIAAAGGEANIATTDFPDYWFPESLKGHVSDDISANISPALYRRFSRPFHDMVFARYGGGGLHNCGPNPCLAQYLEHKPAPRSLDLSYRYSRRDLPKIKRICRKRAIVYLNDLPQTPGELIETYRRLMEDMAPDVMVIPVATVTTADTPAEVYARLLEISREYARRMDWGWVGGDPAANS
ncbi:MAG: hypothetical protein AAB225_12005 [Acidobacteriota bacterium]